MEILQLLIFPTLLLILTFAAILYLVYKLGVEQEWINIHRDAINRSYDDFLRIYENDRYFSKRDLNKWMKENEATQELIDEYIKYEKKVESYYKITKILQPMLNIKPLDDNFKKKVLYLQNIFANGNDLREKRNSYYVKGELEQYDDFFNNVCNKPLSEEQRIIIVTDEAHNLVVAGAGTGKTLTIVGKTGYLLKKGIAEPGDLLLLSFARKVKDELKTRINKRLHVDLEVRTFHKLGLDIIRRSLGYNLRLSDLAGDARNRTKTIDTLLLNRLTDVGFANKLNEYFVYYLRPVENDLDFKSEEEYDQYLRGKEIRTLGGEKVESHAECMIANFLHLNGIRYLYEEPYPHTLESERQYRPDFYIPDYGLWIEHLGIDRHCNTAPDVDRWKYLDEWYWKRQTHEKHRTTLIETYSYERTEGTLIPNLRKQLVEKGVSYKPLPKEKVFESLKTLGEVNQFSGLLTKFLNLYKSDPQPMEKLKEKANRYPYRRRYLAFLDIFNQILEDYTALLRDRGEIDFHDMINLATDQIRAGAYQSRFRYILVDEFQDMSQSRCRLLKALLDNGGDTQLFCVGDDWQSIYRFAGSDLSLMVNFEAHFTPHELMYLTRTYRFNDKINAVTSRFIEKNPGQYRKSLQADQADHPGVTLVWYNLHEDAYRETLNHISSLENPAEVQIIGRYSEKFYPELSGELTHKGSLNQLRLDEPPRYIKQRYSTAHSSKGTESDYVVLLGVKSDKYGVPCEVEDDPILRLVLSEMDSYPYAEERRVFYVALTRARKQAFILCDKNRVSRFVTELVTDDPDIPMRGESPIIGRCPECKTGLIIKENQNGRHSASCSNPSCLYRPKLCPECKNGILLPETKISQYRCSNGDCPYTARMCPWCGDGYLIEHEKDGKFWGCSNYKEKDCRYTEPILS